MIFISFITRTGVKKASPSFLSPLLGPSMSLHEDVRRGAEHGDRGHDGEGGVGHQTQPVQHHSSKLPVAFHSSALLIIPDLVRDYLDLLEDEAELPVQGLSGRRGHFLRLYASVG